ncbi:MAG: two-component system response regulator [Comamonadaceae bacterium CG1_02_60_18]|nr:MAG: two-component system response regulator [Comamonadaceae bacterium CG1_02_60_18]
MASQNALATTATVVPQLLLVDDEPRLLDSLASLLGGRGYGLTTASDGRQAMALLQGQAFDLVMLDLCLPDMSGHKVMEFILEQKLDADVIVISGDSGIDAAIGALKRGAYDFLRKPYASEELLKAVNNALKQRELMAQNTHIQQRLERSERQYRHLVNSSPDIIFTLDHEGLFTFVNDRVTPLLGFDRDDLIGRHYSALVHGPDLERADYVFASEDRRTAWSRQSELRLRTNDSQSEFRCFAVELMRVAMSAQGPTAGSANTDGSSAGAGLYCVARDITASKRADELLTYQAYHDVLTKLPNRVMFRDRLSLALLHAKRERTLLAVLFLDLDRFKMINDSLGLQVGDELLQQVTLRLQACLRADDTLARFGSDEFNIVLPGLADAKDATRVAQTLLQSLQSAFQIAKHTIHMTASIGISLYPADTENADELIRNADMAMHSVKSHGRNSLAFFDAAMVSLSSNKMLLENDLHRALTNSELEMYYQPQVDVETGRISGAEALMRWNHPQRGLLGAGEFLPFAEETGLIIELSDWMLDTICLHLLQWNAQGSERVTMSINLSPHYLQRGDFFDKLKSTLQRHRIAPQQIEVEVTENICIRNPLAAIEQLNKLCQLGVKIAIDDFGTGYSSLSYLHLFPIHILKIDRSFVTPIEDESLQFPVVLAIISIAKGLGLKLVAEGVETETQKRYLARAGCQTIQGYYFYKPIRQLDILPLLLQQQLA